MSDVVVTDYCIDAQGFVLIDGKRVLGNAANKQVIVQLEADTTCQRCGKQTPRPVALYHRYEHALERDMYWFGLKPGVAWGHCDECVRKGATWTG